MKYLKEMIKSPEVAILKAKKEKNFNKTLLILLKEWVLIALGIVILGAGFGRALSGVSAAVTVFAIGILGTMFCALLLKKIMVILGGKGKYFEALTAKVYAILPLSIGFLLATILSMVPLIGSALVFIVLALSVVRAVATLYRGIKELFSVDLITAWIGIGVLVGSIVLAFYIALFVTLAGNPIMLQTLGKSSIIPMMRWG